MKAARQIYLGRGAGAKLPYDAEVEWLGRHKASGVCVNTGVFIDDDDYTIECDCRISAVYAEWSGPYQAYYNEQTECTRVIMFSNDLSKMYCGYRRLASSQGRYDYDWTERKRSVLSYQNVKVYDTDGVLATDHVLSAPSGNVRPGGEEVKLSGILNDCYWYGFKISHAGADVLDYVPVRKGDVGYFYDRVSGNLVGIDASVSDKFIIGPDKS